MERPPGFAPLNPGYSYLGIAPGKDYLRAARPCGRDAHPTAATCLTKNSVLDQKQHGLPEPVSRQPIPHAPR